MPSFSVTTDFHKPSPRILPDYTTCFPESSSKPANHPLAPSYPSPSSPSSTMPPTLPFLLKRLAHSTFKTQASSSAALGISSRLISRRFSTPVWHGTAPWRSLRAIRWPSQLLLPMTSSVVRQSRGMKVRSSVKKLCDGCKVRFSGDFAERAVYKMRVRHTGRYRPGPAVLEARVVRRNVGLRRAGC